MTVPGSDARLDELAREVAAEVGVVGAQVAVLHRGELREGAVGLASRVTGLPVTTDTVFQIGSTSKLYAAALLMQLVADDAVGLDVPVVEQLPEFRLPDVSALKVLTPRQLMSMTSGLDNGSYNNYGQNDDAMARYVAELAELPLCFFPGTGFGYSNASTNVSGRLTEHVLGQPWDVLVRERLLEPAGLTRSVSSPEELPYRSVAIGHTEEGEPVPAWEQNRAMAAAGTVLCCSAGDLARFGQLFLRDGQSLDGTQVLPAGVVAQMHAREVDVPPTLLAEWWGLGPYGKTWDGVDVLGHSGTWRAGSSYLLWAPERDLAIATTVNVPSFGYPFARRCFEVLFEEVGGIKVPPVVQPPDHVDYDPRLLVGSYEMHGVRFVIEHSGGRLTGAIDGSLYDEPVPPSELLPLTSTTFLPTHPAFDGRRGYGLAFVGTDLGPATHVVNGFMALRRTG